MKFSGVPRARRGGSKESVWRPEGNAAVPTALRNKAPELSDSPGNDPLRVNNPVTTGLRKHFSNRST